MARPYLIAVIGKSDKDPGDRPSPEALRAARDVLARAGAELARLAGTVIRRLFPHPGIVQVAMSGGVFASSPLVCQSFYNNLHSERTKVTINPTVVEPVRGALELARKKVSNETLRR